MKGKKLTVEQRAKISASNRRRRLSDATREKMRQAQLPHRAARSRSMQARRSTPEFEKKMHAARLAAPNKLETAVQAFLNEWFPGSWVYNDGAVILDRLVPDFVCVKHQHLLLEVFGDYWHAGEDPDERKDRYARLGYDCVVVWESEFKHDPFVLFALLRSAFRGGISRVVDGA